MVALITLFLLLLAPSVTRATTYYVATTGSNSNSGTSEESPWLTIQHAVTTMVAGDTTYVRGGTYSGNTQIWFKKTGTAASPIKLLAYPNESPVISCDGSENEQHQILLQHASGIVNPIGYITISGFETTGCYSGIKWYNAHDTTVSNNYIHNSLHTGILGQGGARILITRNIIANNVTTDPATNAHGIYSHGSAYTITHNLIYGNEGYGIQQNGSSSSTYSAAIHAGPEFAGADGWIVSDNTFAYQINASGYVIWGSRCTNLRLENNIFYENERTGSASDSNAVRFVSGTCTGVQIRNNHSYASGSGGQTFISGTGGVENTTYTQSGNVTNVSPPAFVNAGSNSLPASPDFRLTASAPTNIARVNEFANNSTLVVGAYKTVGAPTAVITTNKIILTFPMSTAVPIQNLSTAGISFSCTANVCPGSPVVSAVSRVVGSDNQVEIGISGITSNACLSHTDPVTVTYAPGVWTANDNIGTYPGSHQSILAFSSVSVTNQCTGSGPASYPAGYHIYYKFDEGAGTNANDESANNLDCTLTNSATWGTGKTGSAMVVAAGSTQHCTIPWGSGVNPSTQSLTVFVPVNIATGAESAVHYVGGPDHGTNQRAYICAKDGTWRVAIQTTTCSATAASNLAVTAGWNALTLIFNSATDTFTLYKDAVAGTGGAAGSYTSFVFATNWILGRISSANSTGGSYDDFLVYLSVQNPSDLVAAFNAAPPSQAGTLDQAAVQFQGVILDALGSPLIIGGSSVSIEVPTGGGVALLFQVHCTNVSDCALTAFKLVYAKNGTGVWQQVPDMETTDGTWMWGVTTEANLNNKTRSTRLTGSCAVTLGATQVTSAQTPSVDLPQDGCVVLAYIVRVKGTAGVDYFDFKLRTESNSDFSTYSQTARLRVVNPMSSGVGF